MDPLIGAAELKELLFNKCKEEWAEVNYGHELDITKLQLSTADLIEITPPEDGSDDVNCLAAFLYKPTKASNTLTFTLPKAPIHLVLSMNSKDFTAFTKYFDEQEEAMANQGHVDVDQLEQTDEACGKLVFLFIRLLSFA